MRNTAYPGAQDFVRDLLEPAGEDQMLERFGPAEVK
jgi:hypothetical protein